MRLSRGGRSLINKDAMRRGADVRVARAEDAVSEGMAAVSAVWYVDIYRPSRHRDPFLRARCANALANAAPPHAAGVEPRAVRPVRYGRRLCCVVRAANRGRLVAVTTEV